MTALSSVSKSKPSDKLAHAGGKPKMEAMYASEMPGPLRITRRYSQNHTPHIYINRLNYAVSDSN
jgi:hypothetical protein